MFIPITFRGTSIDETNKTAESQRLKICVQNVHQSREPMHSNDYITAQSLLLQWWCGPAVSTRLADVLSTPSQVHIMDLRTVDPLLKDTPDAVVHRIGELGGHISGGINSWRLSLSLSLSLSIYASKGKRVTSKERSSNFSKICWLPLLSVWQCDF